MEFLKSGFPIKTSKTCQFSFAQKDEMSDESILIGRIISVLRRPGGYGEGPTPDPIPNSVVKPLSADGTAS